VVIRNHHELQDKPVAVCHSDNTKGTAEISSANYPARDYGWFVLVLSISIDSRSWGFFILYFSYISILIGIRAGIFVRDAKALCPHLVIFPYNFKAYEEVSSKLYI
jgi:DNA repair protein REV1